MIAIPLDNKESTVLSELYGNAPFFALLDKNTGTFKVVENDEVGNGPKSAEFLKTLGVDSTIYYHMGEGVYKSFIKNGLEVFTSDHTKYTLDEIFDLSLNEKLLKLNDSNYKELLDPGSAGACKCGCND